MKIEHDIWIISSGKGDRMYIKCINDNSIMHPEDICGINGLGMHGWEKMQSLAIAILKFEKAQNEANSVLNKI
jgi:hypothetical protein